MAIYCLTKSINGELLTRQASNMVASFHEAFQTAVGGGVLESFAPFPSRDICFPVGYLQYSSFQYSKLSALLQQQKRSFQVSAALIHPPTLNLNLFVP